MARVRSPQHRDDFADGERCRIPSERIVLGGFPQGACLATEFVATRPRRYAGLLAFTGGLLGPLGADLSHEGDLQGTPAFFGSATPIRLYPGRGCSILPGILAAMGAVVTARRYPDRSHTISAAEIDFAKRLLLAAFGENADNSEARVRTSEKSLPITLECIPAPSVGV
jgi:predicted esterase